MQFLFVILSVLCAISVAVNDHDSQRNTTEEFDPSKVVIVMSMGTSGSTMLCDVVRNIAASGEVSFGNELLGGKASVMSRKEDPVKTVRNYLIQQQKLHPGEMVGFKYKNYFHNDKYDELLRWISEQKIKMIYNTRNPLDRYIGTLKSADPDGKHNCPIGRSNCADKQLAIKVEVPLDGLIEKLDHEEASNTLWSARLKVAGINFLHVTYEGVVQGTMKDRINYVQKIADFLHPGYKVTEKTFSVHTEFIGHPSQRDFVTNFKALKNKLENTRFEQYLH